MRWLCTLLPTITDPRPGPRSGWVNIYWDTSTFSPPWPQRTLEGRPNNPTASTKGSRTVLAQLLLEHDKYTWILENPSTPPCITIRYLVRQCYVLMILELNFSCVHYYICNQCQPLAGKPSLHRYSEKQTTFVQQTKWKAPIDLYSVSNVFLTSEILRHGQPFYSRQLPTNFHGHNMLVDATSSKDHRQGTLLYSCATYSYLHAHSPPDGAQATATTILSSLPTW